VRQSFIQNKPIEWRRVYRVPDFVFFNHSIHVNKGVGLRELPRPRSTQMAAVREGHP
jgi:hypothetical protein